MSEIFSLVKMISHKIKLQSIAARLLVFGFFFMLFSSCGVYNFTGGAIPPNVKTISIQNIYNESGQGPANLSNIITEKLKAYYQNNTRLLLVKTGGDWQIDGKITGYVTSSVAPKANETSASNRLTINVMINFVSEEDEKQNFNQAFSQYDDFPGNQTLSQVETNEIDVITTKLIFDIFTKTTSNW